MATPRASRQNRSEEREEREKVSFVAERTLLDRIDSYGEALRESTPGLGVSRTDVIKILILRGLELHAVK